MDPTPNPSEVAPAAAPLLCMQFMSDLHIEFARARDYSTNALLSSLSLSLQALQLLPKWTAQAPVLALLGDIGKVNQDKYKNFIEAQAKMFERVLVLFGNHEYGLAFHLINSDTPNARSSFFFFFLRYVCMIAPRICHDIPDDDRYYGGDSYDTLMSETRTAFAHLKNVTFMQKTAVTIGGVCILGAFPLPILYSL